MSFNLAPYNDAMRLGQGFNSYTQDLCIDKAVLVTGSKINDSKNTSQVVSYSVRIVEKLSDVLEGMNVSYCQSIKKGTIEVGGSTNTVNENSFKASDLNAVISCKVTNQTLTIDDDAKFQPLERIPAGSAVFNQTYGDSYISGWITGGEFTGIVSIKAIDRSKTTETINAIKSSLSALKKTDDAFSPFDGISGSTLSNAMSGTEVTISVAWRGGGQIKPAEIQWDLESVMAAAAAFPARVAECPQRTWAILTKYKANRSYVDFTSAQAGKLLEYDQISSYTAELFDNYMEYKLLIKQVQAILDNSDLYESRAGVVNALDISVETMLSARAVLRGEQAKIVEAVEALSKDPGLLKRSTHKTNISKSLLVNRILSEALDRQSSVVALVMPQVATGRDGAVAAEGVSLAANASITSSSPTSDFDFSVLVDPEVWAAVMPVQKPIVVAQAQNGRGYGIDTYRLPTPPADDYIFPSLNEAKVVEEAQKKLAEMTAAKKAAEKAQKEAEASRDSLNKELTEQVRLAGEKVEEANQKLGQANQDRGTAVTEAKNLASKLSKATSDIEELTEKNRLLDDSNKSVEGKRGTAVKELEIERKGAKNTLDGVKAEFENERKKAKDTLDGVKAAFDIERAAAKKTLDEAKADLVTEQGKVTAAETTGNNFKTSMEASQAALRSFKLQASSATWNMVPAFELISGNVKFGCVLYGGTNVFKVKEVTAQFVTVKVPAPTTFAGPLLARAADKQPFKVGSEIFSGYDPEVGKVKWLFISYTLQGSDEPRFIMGRDGEERRFE